mmetsp:Transcript_63201/g.206255  ORF Transcript_63201/g.206255 Transcript_63201/m.206255 type:complete len:248 (+) Transcript_63201:3-746(+)
MQHSIPHPPLSRAAAARCSQPELEGGVAEFGAGLRANVAAALLGVIVDLQTGRVQVVPHGQGDRADVEYLVLDAVPHEDPRPRKRHRTRRGRGQAKARGPDQNGLEDVRVGHGERQAKRSPIGEAHDGDTALVDAMQPPRLLQAPREEGSVSARTALSHHEVPSVIFRPRHDNHSVRLVRHLSVHGGAIGHVALRPELPAAVQREDDRQGFLGVHAVWGEDVREPAAVGDVLLGQPLPRRGGTFKRR